jgi:acyl-CoA thioester hydrolase
MRKPFISRQRVHFDMMDPAGTVHNSIFLIFFERARTDYWNTLNVTYGSEDFDYPYLVARNEVNYRKALRTDQEITVTVAVSRLGKSSITFAHELYDAVGDLSADGGTVIVRIDPETGRSRPWTDRFRKMIAGIRTDEDPN